MPRPRIGARGRVLRQRVKRSSGALARTRRASVAYVIATCEGGALDGCYSVIRDQKVLLRRRSALLPEVFSAAAAAYYLPAHEDMPAASMI